MACKFHTIPYARFNVLYFMHDGIVYGHTKCHISDIYACVILRVGVRHYNCMISECMVHGDDTIIKYVLIYFSLWPVRTAINCKVVYVLDQRWSSKLLVLHPGNLRDSGCSIGLYPVSWIYTIVGPSLLCLYIYYISVGPVVYYVHTIDSTGL